MRLTRIGKDKSTITENEMQDILRTDLSTEIHEFIQAGIDEKVLDVDGDGQVTALGDGLMVI